MLWVTLLAHTQPQAEHLTSLHRFQSVWEQRGLIPQEVSESQLIFHKAQEGSGLGKPFVCAELVAWGCLNRCMLVGWSAGGGCDVQLVLAVGLWSAPCTQSTALVAVGPCQCSGHGEALCLLPVSPCQSCTTWLTTSRILGLAASQHLSACHKRKPGVPKVQLPLPLLAGEQMGINCWHLLPSPPLTAQCYRILSKCCSLS